MKQDKQFDELARRKLDERSFPFEEADWLAARALIDAQGDRARGIAWPYWTLIVLLLAGGLAWYGLADTDKPAPPDAPVASLDAGPALPGTDPGSDAGLAANAPVDLAEPQVEANTTEELPQKLNEIASTAPDATAVAEGRKVDAGPRTSPPPQPPTGSQSTEVITVSPIRHDASARQDVDEERDTSLPDQPRGEADVVHTTDAPSTVILHGTAPDDENIRTDDPVLPAVPAREPLTEFPAVHAVGTDTAMQAESTAPTALADPQPQDSAASIAPVPPDLIPPRAPWEISLTGGLFSSRTVYRGGNSSEWAHGSSPARSPSFGVEVMHMGRNIGLGLGLHWSSYAERLHTDARREQVTTFHEHWEMVPFHMTILVITDTLPGTPPSYQGTPVDTVLNIFTQVTDTLTEEHVVRDARSLENRVSYLEVPLLADVHLVQGRWTLGLRGGPTLGLLTGRRGALPNATDDGYVLYSDQAFRELMLGYTARAYVRYRFNAGWSVGLEPAVRGQLLNSLDNGSLSKRSHATGLLLSLTYRLR